MSDAKQPNLEGVLDKMLLEVLENSIRQQKDYRTLIDDGSAMIRLRQSEDFKRYQRLMAESYLALVERLRLADTASLTALQGSLVQHFVLMKLPQRVLDMATKAVEVRRQDSEGVSLEAR